MKYLLLIKFVFLFTVSNAQQLLQTKMQLCKPAGAKDSVFCGNYSVFENHQTKQGRKISLYLIVIPAINSSTKKNPIFYFDGGPGVGTTKNINWLSAKNNPYRQNHDVVLVDIRGTGGSNPLHCYALQYQKGLAEEFDENHPSNKNQRAKEVKACYDSLSKKADLAQYTTTNIVHDMEEVRQWLGYQKVHLFGLSYGGRLAMEYMRRFPSSIETVVLHSPLSTNDRVPLNHAKYTQATLDKLINDCAEDSLCKTTYPNLKEEFNELMSAGRKANFKTSYTFANNTTKQLSIPWDVFQTKLRTWMYEPRYLRQIPYIVHEAYTGNWKPFLSTYSEKGNYSTFYAEGLYLCITCSEDVPFIKKREAEPLSKKTFMGAYRIQQLQAACANWSSGIIPKDFLQPVRSAIPTLILSGEWDPVTPVSMAKGIVRYLPNSQWIILPQMSHLFDGLSNEECFDNIIVAYINDSGKSRVNSSCITTMTPPPYKIK